MHTDSDKIDEYLSHLSEGVRNQFRIIYDTVLQFNSKLNLLPNSTLRLSASYNFSDCVIGLQGIEGRYPFPDAPVTDFGSGNGFPGLILAVLRPELTIHLVEKDLRKAEFLSYLISQLGLLNARVLTQSMESLPRLSVSCGLVRNVGSLDAVAIQLTSVFKESGHLFHFKTDNWSSEIARCPTQVFSRWDIGAIFEYSLPVSKARRSVLRSTKL